MMQINGTRLRLKLIALVSAVIILLTGCVGAEENIIIKKDGSASVELFINIDRTAYLSECAENAETLSGEEITTIDENMEAQGATIVSVNGKEFYRMPIVDNNKLGNKELLEQFYIPGTIAYITGLTFYWKTSAAAIYAEEFSDLNLDEMGITLDQLNSVPLNISVQFSKEIENYQNGTVDSDNSKRILFSLKGKTQKVLFASTKDSSTLGAIEKRIADLNKTGTTKFSRLQAKKVPARSKKASVYYKIKSVKTSNGYQIQYATKKNFSNSRTKTIKKTSGTITGLKKKTKYYFRVRVRKSNYAGVNVYGKWSAAKVLKTKK